MKQRQPETSLEAYRSIDPRDLRETYRQILFALDNIGEGTFEDIAAYLKVSPQKIWKRLSELSKMELVYRPGNRKLLKSGRSGFTWMKGNPVKTDTQMKEGNIYKKGVNNAADYAIKLLQATQKDLFS